jgi:putative Mn2+ efflux pump MntP
MPLVGLAVGASLGHAVGSTGDYLSGGLLIALAGYLRWADNDDNDVGDHDDGDGNDGEVAKAGRLATARGLALLGLGLSISLDELAIGFSLGLGSHRGVTLAQVATIIIVIVIQTLIVSQVGLSLGTRISQRLRERIDQLTSPGLAIFGGYLLSGQLIHAGLLTTLDIVVLAALLLIPVTVILYRARRSTPPAASSQIPREPLVTASTGLLTNPAPRTPSRTGRARHRVHHAGTRHPHLGGPQPVQHRWRYVLSPHRGRLIRVRA